MPFVNTIKSGAGKARLRWKAGLRRGATTVEFAVVASVFFIFIFGVIEVGRGLMVKHLLTSAARQGCRVGVIEGKANSDITAAVASAFNSQGINGYSVAVQVNNVTADVANSNPGDQVTVTVSAPVSSVTWVPGMHFLKGTITGQYTLRRE
jgi:Flp pilus assembly protein TadG